MERRGRMDRASRVASPTLTPGVSLEACRIVSRALAASVPADDRLSLARAFGGRLVSAWWRTLTSADARSFPLRAPLQPVLLPELPGPVASLVDGIARAIAELDAEAAAYQIGLAYTGMLPPEHRATYGIHCTPLPSRHA